MRSFASRERERSRRRSAPLQATPTTASETSAKCSVPTTRPDRTECRARDLAVEAGRNDRRELRQRAGGRFCSLTVMQWGRRLCGPFSRRSRDRDIPIPPRRRVGAPPHRLRRQHRRTTRRRSPQSYDGSRLHGALLEHRRPGDAAALWVRLLRARNRRIGACGRRGTYQPDHARRDGDAAGGSGYICGRCRATCCRMPSPSTRPAKPSD